MKHKGFPCVLYSVLELKIFVSALAQTIAFTYLLPQFSCKKWIFHVFIWKNIDLSHLLDPIQYEFLFLCTTLAEPEPKLRCTGSGQKFRLLAAPDPQHWYCTQLDIWISDWRGFCLNTLQIGLKLPSENILGQKVSFYLAFVLQPFTLVLFCPPKQRLSFESRVLLFQLQFYSVRRLLYVILVLDWL